MVLAAVDVETYDPLLKKLGSGAIRKDGYLIGVGIYSPQLGLDGFFEPGNPTIKEVMEREDVTKVFHNGVYDLDWLWNNQHYNVRGRLEDTMTRETLLDSYQLSYSLDACCARHNIEGKNKADTIEAWYKQEGGKGKAVEHLNLIPFDIVGRYCIQDCKATYDLFNVQQPLLEEQGLLNANDIECRLYPALMAMRRNGFPLDFAKRASLSKKLEEEYTDGIHELEDTYGFERDSLSLNRATQLEKIWKAEGLPIEYTETGKPSFAAAVLADCPHPVAQTIHRLKTIQKTLNTFIDGGFVDASYKGRLWSTFYPAKRDEGGTVTGRWSSRDINFQQIPAREDKFGIEMRSLFIPEEGYLLGAFDYKQIEYRVFTHFSSGYGSAEAKEQFNKDPSTDYHTMGQKLMGWYWEDDPRKTKVFRHTVKNLGFGSLYGMGPRSFAERFKQPLLAAHPEADPDNLLPLATSLMNEYERKVSYIKPTQQSIMNIGTKRGYVRTLSGRHQRMPYDAHGKPQAYKLINYLIQGSAADLLKKAMVDAWDAGVFKILKLHAVVHDEIVFSIPKSKEGYKACKQLYSFMVNAYKLSIPLGVDTEIGPDWGHCNEENWDEFASTYGN